MSMLPDDRAYPGQFGQYTNYGFTKREAMAQYLMQAIVAGLYSFQGNLGSMTEAEVAKSAVKLTDALIKKL
jgi:hypothetical protein